MSGVKGMYRKTPDSRSLRGRIWRVMRRRVIFCIDDLVIPIEGANVSNTRKFIANLERHGIVRMERWNGKEGQPGSFKIYRLIRNTGPDQPTVCPVCKRPVTAKECTPEASHDNP